MCYFATVFSRKQCVWRIQKFVNIIGVSNPFSGAFFHCYVVVKVKVKSLSRVRLLVTPWTVAYQAPLSIGFSRQEYWSGLPFLSPGYLPKPGIKPGSPALQTNALQVKKTRGTGRMALAAICSPKIISCGQ